MQRTRTPPLRSSGPVSNRHRRDRASQSNQPFQKRRTARGKSEDFRFPITLLKLTLALPSKELQSTLADPGGRAASDRRDAAAARPVPVVGEALVGVFGVRWQREHAVARLIQLAHLREQQREVGFGGRRDHSVAHLQQHPAATAATEVESAAEAATATAVSHATATAAAELWRLQREPLRESGERAAASDAQPALPAKVRTSVFKIVTQ